jgi:hypothetical protein
VCRHLFSREHACGTAQQSPGADRQQELFILNVPADELKHFLIVQQRLLPITARYKQNVK